MIRIVGYAFSHSHQQLHNLMLKHTLSIVAIATFSSVCLIAENDAPQEIDPLKVLYVTHEPGKWHKYTPQRQIFEKIAKEHNWDLTVMSGSHDEVEEKLATQPHFGEGADVIVYNFCMAHSTKLGAPHNIIQQTKEKGIPAFLIHCSLHSFWATYKESDKGVHPEGANPKAMAQKELVAQWKEQHPDTPFPAWPNMTGIASTRHGKRAPIEAKPLDASHPCFKGVETYTTHKKAELYNNFISIEESPKSTVLMEGHQFEQSAAILWEHPLGKSKSLSFTLGHGIGEWQQEPFQKIIANSVHYLAHSK